VHFADAGAPLPVLITVVQPPCEDDLDMKERQRNSNP